MRFDRSLLTALFERWMSEISMFHLREGEMTVTLQDVTVLLSLRIDGPSFTETDEREIGLWSVTDCWCGASPDGYTRWTGEFDMVA